jgi:hypothetical protein
MLNPDGLQRIAVVGAYGNGKTTLTSILSERLRLRRTQGTPMKGPSGITGRSLEECTEPEMIQLVIRRLNERTVGEADGHGGFISDGSVLHEWIYAKVRLAVGLHPAPGAMVADAPGCQRTAAYKEVVDQIGFLAKEHARSAYDCFIHVPAEVPLAESPRPISEYFRTLSDRLLLDVLPSLGLPVSMVSGGVDERIAQALDATRQRPSGANS